MYKNKLLNTINEICIQKNDFFSNKYYPKPLKLNQLTPDTKFAKTHVYGKNETI